MPGEPEREIELHAKLIIVDDMFVRIGSSNLNTHSLGLETHLAIEAAGPDTRAAIAQPRATLLADHLVRTPAEVGGAIAESGAIGALERLNPGRGRIRPCAIDRMPAQEAAAGCRRARSGRAAGSRLSRTRPTQRAAFALDMRAVDLDDVDARRGPSAG